MEESFCGLNKSCLKGFKEKKTGIYLAFPFRIHMKYLNENKKKNNKEITYENVFNSTWPSGVKLWN